MKDLFAIIVMLICGLATLAAGFAFDAGLIIVAAYAVKWILLP